MLPPAVNMDAQRVRVQHLSQALTEVLSSPASPVSPPITNRRSPGKVTKALSPRAYSSGARLLQLCAVGSKASTSVRKLDAAGPNSPA